MRGAIVATALALALASCGGGGGDGAGEAPRPVTPPSAGQPPAGSQFGRNVVRVPGLSPSDVAGAAAMAAYPPERGTKPSGFVLTREDAWRDLAVAAQFAAEPVNAAIVPIKRDYLPTAAVDVVNRVKPRGFRNGRGMTALVLGSAGEDVFTDLQDASLKPSQLKASSPARLAERTVPYRGGFAGKFSDAIAVVSSSERDYVLPAAAWSAFSGDSLAFVSRDGIPPSTRRMLAQREKLRARKPTMYVIGPPSVVPERVVRALRAFGRVKRVGGATAAETAVALARYRDPETGFGWGMTRAPLSVSLVNPARWQHAAAAINLAGGGPRAAMLLTEGPDRLPAATLRYLRETRGAQPGQAFAFGDEKSIATGLLARVDAELEPRGGDGA